MSSISIDPLLGRTLANKFELQELLGVGAMGKVYRAHHGSLDRTVAIKILISVPAIAEAQARRFKAEARAASRLEHPNSVQILDFGEEGNGLFYIVMEHLDGIDLQDVIAQGGPVGPQRTAWIMSQVFSAVGAAHAHGVIHRDIKPGNVMLVEKNSEDGVIKDFVKVCDFGLAKIMDAGSEMTGGPLTAQGAVFGTPAYMSPEQARGEPLDPRSDIYSCGVLMYKMLVGHTPFRAESPTGVLMGHIQEEPPPLNTWGIEVHPALAAVVERAMLKDPAHRYQNAKEARDELRAMLASEGLSHPPLTATAQTPVRASTSVPTEQVRVRNSEIQTQEDAQDTLLDRSTEEEATRYEMTMAQPAPTAASPLATLQGTLPIVAQTKLDVTPPTAPAAAAATGTPMWAVVPGALALIAAAGLFGVLLMKPNREPATVAPPPKSAPKLAAQNPNREKPRPEPKDGTEQAQIPETPTNVNAVNAPGQARPRPPSIENSGAQASTLDPASTTTTQPLPQPGPAGPALHPGRAPRHPRLATRPLSGNFKLIVTLSNLKVEGAFSRMRVKAALQRHMEKMRTCTRELIAVHRVQTAGSLQVHADVDARGRLRNIEATGLVGATACMHTALSSARLPPADMGLGKVRFTLRYRTVSP